MKPRRCESCGQIIPPKLLFEHQPVKKRIYDFIAKHPEGVSRDQILDAVYADDPDGGPTPQAVSVHIFLMRRVLNPLGLTITSPRGRGASFRLIAMGGAE